MKSVRVEMEAGLRLLGLLCVCAAIDCAAAAVGEAPVQRSAADVVASLKLPPDWIDSTPVEWDLNRPWKEARLEIRRLLALDEARVRQGVKLTWLYAQKGDIGDGHELPMYLFMSGNYGWALRQYPSFLERQRGQGPTHAYLCYASCLAHFGDFAAAQAVLEQASRDLPPAPWRITNQANIHNQLGDLYGQMGQASRAREHYLEAARLYGISDQPYGRHLLPRKAAQVHAKLRLMTMASLGAARLRDGAYSGRSIGYSDQGDIQVRIRVLGGRIASIDVDHQEKIELGATRIIPQRILERQSLSVDGVTGATVTCQGIVEATYRALAQAGWQ